MKIPRLSIEVRKVSMAPGDALVSDLNRLELAHAAENANTDVVNLPASGCTNVGSSVECKCKCCKVPVCAGPGTLEIDPLALCPTFSTY